MDIYCTRCGEPWDVYYVRHEEPQGFRRTGSMITACPACMDKAVTPSTKEQERLALIRHLAQLSGNDLDGLAADLEDFGL